MRLRCCLVALLGGCAGPPALDRAILPRDETEYREALAQNSDNPRDAFLAWKARQRSITLAEARALDAQLSAKQNPFDANHDRAAVSRGAVIYKLSCARCHGDHADGKGPDALPGIPSKSFHTPAKRFAVWLHRGAPHAWFRKIHDGAGPRVSYPDGENTAMPAFADTLSNEQIWLVVTYLQSLDAYTGPAADIGGANTRDDRRDG